MADHRRELAVLVDHERCGTIIEGVGLSYEFAYTAEWCADGRPGLSLALPSDGTVIQQERSRA